MNVIQLHSQASGDDAPDPVTAAIERLAQKTEFADMAAYLRENPWHYPRFVRDTRNAGIDLEDVFSPNRISVTLHPAANDDYYRKAANFSTSEGNQAPPQWIGEIHYGQGVLKISAEPDACDDQKVYVTAWIEGDAMPELGERITFLRPGGAGDAGIREAEFAVGGHGIQAETSFPCSWEEFVGDWGRNDPRNSSGHSRQITKSNSLNETAF